MTETILRYKTPARDFSEALPIGNGRMGGMVFGKPADELIRLNEDSLWSGGLRHRINPNAQEGLAEIRELLKEGDIPAAERVAFTKMQGVPENMRHYMPLGDLTISMEFGGKARDYSRILDLSTAVTGVSFSANGVLYTRNVFCSAPMAFWICVRFSSRPLERNNNACSFLMQSSIMRCFLNPSGYSSHGTDLYFPVTSPVMSYSCPSISVIK